ncbi:MAG: beta-ketoacyl synthase N-terminal-like domain-containing protein [Bacillota bacterium]
MSSGVFITAAGLIKADITEGAHNNKIEAGSYESILENFELRNVDRISKLVLASAGMALSSEGTDDFDGSEYGLILGTQYGPLDSIHNFDMFSLENGALAVNPGLFPNTVLNSPSCQASIRFSISGPVYTVSNGATSALDSIGLAYNHIKAGLIAKILVGGVDEINDLQNMVHSNNKPVGEAAGFIVMKSADSVDKPDGMVEIKSFYSECNNTYCFHGEEEQISKRISEILSSMDINLQMVSDINIGLFVNSENEQVFIRNISNLFQDCERINYQYIDWMGANGLVHIAEAIQRKRNNNNEKMSLFIIIDNTRISVLATSSLL